MWSSAIQLHTHVHYSSNFFLWVLSKFLGSRKIFDSFSSGGALACPAAALPTSMVSSCPFNWSTFVLRFNAKRWAFYKSCCCCSIKSQSSPVKFPHSPSINQAVVRAAASDVWRAVMMYYKKWEGWWDTCLGHNVTQLICLLGHGFLRLVKWMVFHKSGSLL